MWHTFSSEMIKYRTTCDCCLKKKIKCDGKKPACGHCLERGFSSLCHYGIKQRPGRKRAAPKSGNQINAIKEEDKVVKRPKFVPKVEVYFLGRQETYFLEIYLKLFEDHFPAVNSALHCKALSKLTNKSRAEAGAMDASKTSQELADMASLWAGIAIGSVLMGNRRDVEGYIQQAEQALQGSNGSIRKGEEATNAIATAHMHLALMYEWIGNEEKSLYHLFKAEVQQGLDSKTIGSIKALKLLIRLGLSDAINFIFQILGDFEGTVFSAKEFEEFPLSMRIFYDNVVTMMKMTFFYKGTEANAYQIYNDMYSNCLLAEAHINQRDHVSTISFGLIQFQMAALEIGFLGKFELGIKRIRQLVDVLCNAHVMTLLIGPFWQFMDLFAYVMWLTGDVITYNKMMVARNGLLQHKPQEKPLLAFEDMDWEGFCNHRFCQTFMPKFRSSVRLYAEHELSPVNAQEKPDNEIIQTKVSTARVLWAPPLSDIKQSTAEADGNNTQFSRPWDYITPVSSGSTIGSSHISPDKPQMQGVMVEHGTGAGQRSTSFPFDSPALQRGCFFPDGKKLPPFKNASSPASETGNATENSFPKSSCLTSQQLLSICPQKSDLPGNLLTQNNQPKGEIQQVGDEDTNWMQLMLQNEFKTMEP